MLVKGISNVTDSINYNETNANNEIDIIKRISSDHILVGKEKHQGEERKFTEEELIYSIESANKHFTAFDRRFEFSIHENTKHILVKVIDANTEEVIREIPPEKILDLVAAIWEIAGIIVDERI